MLRRVQILFFKLRNRLSADFAQWQQHVKGMEAGGIYIYLGGHTGAF